MMKNSLLAVIALLLTISLTACGNTKVAESTSMPSHSVTVTPTVTATNTPTSPAVSVAPATILSEQPDMAAYHKYFSDLGIGRMPPGENVSPLELEKNVTVFKTTDQICCYGTIILECQLTSTMYDTVAGKVVEEGGLPKPMTGGFAGWEPMPVPAGKYEYKIYVSGALVAIFPFEVQ
jgi:hypothetical protein